MSVTRDAQFVARKRTETQSEKMVLEQDPSSPVSLGIANSEAVQDAATHDDTKYSLGSVLNHVLLHQTVIGLDARQQMELAGKYPHVVNRGIRGESNMPGEAVAIPADDVNGTEGRHRAVVPEG